MINRRTDLAVEAHQLWRDGAQKTTELSGVEARDQTRHGCPVTVVNVLNGEGAQAIGKPVGCYVTVEMTNLRRRDDESFEKIVLAVSEELKAMVGAPGSVMVVGLGNREITPDAVGPIAVEKTIATRHLIHHHPEYFGHMRPVAAITPGVLGSTGIESVDVIRGVANRVRPDLLIVVDALASRKLSRLCTTVQITDTGIVPGSGVGNARAALNRDTLGIPVLALGIPTVVDAGTLAADLFEEAGHGEISAESLSALGGSLIVTPKDIDTLVAEAGRVVGYAINLALHDRIGIADLPGFLS